MTLIPRDATCVRVIHADCKAVHHIRTLRKSDVGMTPVADVGLSLESEQFRRQKAKRTVHLTRNKQPDVTLLIDAIPNRHTLPSYR